MATQNLHADHFYCLEDSLPWCLLGCSPCCIQISTKHQLLRETFPDHPYKYKHKISVTITPYTHLSILSTDHYLSLYDTLGCAFTYVSYTHWNVSPMPFSDFLQAILQGFPSSESVNIKKKVNLLPPVPGFTTLPVTLQGLKTYWYIWSKLWCKL